MSVLLPKATLGALALGFNVILAECPISVQLPLTPLSDTHLCQDLAYQTSVQQIGFPCLGMEGQVAGGHFYRSYITQVKCLENYYAQQVLCH